ncbi:uncharacterized protein LOC135207581 isoform X1 [Macrobrachium nipponense]|uniref:uncharacterized protein LOC135207581 isoform X1 n=2 Tax=Macrobrachium nipponense TaxID=159736 RepID=UPI0030C8D3E6
MLCVARMAEKWDESANDSPEVVYEGFSPPATHSQGMISAGSSFVVTTDGNAGNQVAGSTNYMSAQPVMENQSEAPHHEEIDRARLCFVCCNPVSDKNYESIKTSMNHSHAPLLVLLTDVLGYKLEDGRLHSQVVCKACYHLLDIIDELQQTLTESKTDVRTKFLETVQKLKLKYPRTDKMLKPRCLRCIQMSQSSARKRGRGGRGWKGRSDENMRGKGRGNRGRGRGRSLSNDGSDNDGEGQGVCEGEICKDVLPSKSLHQSSSQGDLKICDKRGNTLPFASRNVPSFTDCSCNDMDPTVYECLMCRKSDTEVFYQYCESCLTCQGTFVPWGVDVTLRFVGEQCSITQINARSYFEEDLFCVLTKGLKLLSPSSYAKEIDYINDGDNEGKIKRKIVSDDSGKKSLLKKSKPKIDVDNEDNAETKEKEKSDDENTENIKPKSKDKDNAVDESEEDGDHQTVEKSNVESSEGEEENEVHTSPGHHGASKSKFPDIDLKLYQPIIKIQESRKVREKQSKRKTKHQRRTLADEFESILTRPTLGKRQIKPTEKVRWLAEQCNRKSEVHPTDEDRGRSKGPTLVKIKSEKEKPEELVSKPEGTEVSPGKRKRKPTEKAQDATDNPKVDKVEGSLKNKETKKYEKTKLTEEELHDSDADPEYVPEANAEESGDSEAEVIVKIKKEIVDDEQGSEDSSMLQEDFAEFPQEDEDSKSALLKRLSEMPVPRKRGRPPGKRRKKRSYIKSELLWDDFEDDQLIVKTDDGREIDLSRLSLKNLQDGDQLYKCPVCGKEYKSQGGMQYHLATHTSSARFSCSLCSYKTIRHGDLKKHYVIHTGIKPYKCEVCHQEFSTSSSYKRHLRIHSGEKPYKCEVCGKDFRNITTRKQHMTLHTGIKNFVCEVCGKSFALKHHYTSHSKRHTGVMPFKCIYCDSAFKTHNALKTHRKKDHPVEEAERIQQNRLRRKSPIKEEKIKVEADLSPDHQVFQAPGDVLEQAMAATVETVDGVHYEYVDVADPSIPLVSKMIKENWNGRDSVVLTITHIEEDEYNEIDDE